MQSANAVAHFFRLTSSTSDNSSNASSEAGRNSCKGGSSRRIVTGSRPSPITGRQNRHAVQAQAPPARHRGARFAPISCAVPQNTRRVEKHMLGAAQADTSRAEAPRALGFLDCFGIGAHLHALVFAAQAITVPKSPDNSGSKVGTRPCITRPDAPSMVMTSPSRNSWRQFGQSGCHNLSALLPHPTHKAAQPPCHNSGMAGHAPARCQNRARGIHAVNIFGAGFHAHQNDIFAARCFHLGGIGGKTNPAAGRPGGAGSPRHNTSIFADGSSVGCNNCSNEAGSRRNRASPSSICPAATISTAIFIAARVVRLPLRVCRINNLPSCTVNSTSCISPKCASSGQIHQPFLVNLRHTLLQ